MADKGNKYFLGLDVGIASVGWAVMAESADGSKRWLDDFGVRLFKAPLEDKTQTTLAAVRRGHRSTRRNLRRRQFRVKRLKQFLVEKKLLDGKKLDDFLNLLRIKENEWKDNKTDYSVEKFSVTNKISGFDETKYINFYHLVNQSLKTEIRPEFLSYVLLYFARHRGYQNFFEQRDEEQIKHDDFKQRIENSKFEDYSELYQNMMKRNLSLQEKHKSNSRIRLIGARNKKKEYLTDVTFFGDQSKNDWLPFKDFYNHKIFKNLWIGGFKQNEIEKLIDFITRLDKPKESVLRKKILSISSYIDGKTALDFAKKLRPYSFLTKKQLLKIINFWNCSKIKVNIDLLESNLKKLQLENEKDKKIERLLDFCKKYRGETEFNFEPLFKNIKKYEKGNPATIRDFFQFWYSDKTLNKTLRFLINFDHESKHMRGKLTWHDDKNWESEKTKWRNQCYFFFRRDFVKKNVELILNRQSKAEKYPQYKVLRDKEIISDIVKIICQQRTFEEGPSFNKKSCFLNVNRYYGFGEEQLNLTSKSSYISGKKVGFRASRVGDLYNACEELSKLTVSFYKAASGETNIIKEFHQQFLKNYCSSKSEFWKKNSKDKSTNSFLSFSPEKLKGWVNEKFKQNDWELPDWFKFSSKKSKQKHEYINISPKVYGFLMNLGKRGYINDEQLSINRLNDKTSSNNMIFKFIKVFHLYYTPHKIVNELKNLTLQHPQLAPIISYLKLDMENESIESARALSRAIGSGMCNLTFDEMTAIILDFWNGCPTSISREKRIKAVQSRSEPSRNWKFLGAISDRNLSYNKTVFRSVNQLRKILRALFDRYKFFSVINIETARELNMGSDSRKKIESEQRENYKLKQDLWKKFLGLGRDRSEFLKFRLWQEQGESCIYCGKPEPFDALQIDHILPQSKFQNDSFTNKVTACWKCNKDKGNYPALKFVHHKFEKSEKWKDYLERVDKLKNERKKQFLRLETFKHDWLKNFCSRSLNDNRYISRYFFNYIRNEVRNYWIREKIKLVHDTSIKYSEKKYYPNINSVNGSVTSQFRSKWFYKSFWGKTGLDCKNQLRSLSDFHHAVDAMVLASFKSKEDIVVRTDQTALLKFTRSNTNKKLRETEPDRYKDEYDGFLKVLIEKYLSESDRNNGSNTINKMKIMLESGDHEHPFLGDLAYQEIDKRIPVKLCFDKKENRIKISDVVDESTYITENKGFRGKIHYPFISYMVNSKTTRGSFGSETLVKKRSKKSQNRVLVEVDKHDNRWERESVWGLYFSKNSKIKISIEFVKTIEALKYSQNGTNGWSNFKGVDLILPFRSLMWKIDGVWKSVFYTGKTGKSLVLKLNGISTHKWWVNKDGKLKSKPMVVGGSKLMKDGLKICSISILGEKISSRDIKLKLN